MRMLRRIPLTRFGWAVVVAIPLLLVVAVITSKGFIAGLAAMFVLFLVLVSLGPPANVRGRFEEYGDLDR